ncbi:NACHT domain-containing protein [Nocardia fluminea]|uniref:NACHT domain-containing protein n=1 Tax=Nocardia fluminea TaxID=134984 RepID=UPI003672D4CD
MRFRRSVIVAGFVLVAAVVFAVSRGLIAITAVTTVCGLLLSALGLYLSRHPAPAAVPRMQQREYAVTTLAESVRIQWEEEAKIRGLADPGPMPVQWALTEADVSDCAPLVFSGRPCFEGSGDRIEALADSFLALRRRRLVILGDPGTGKTTVALQLLLRLLAVREPTDPVPVLLTANSWNFSDHPRMQDWLVARLNKGYPALRALGAMIAHDLVNNNLVLPVIDGLDELARVHRSEFLTRLNESLGVADPLVLTCRSIEYAEAVSNADVLTAAAVIEARPLASGDAADYLDQCLPPRRRHDWEPILDHLRRQNRSPLAEISLTPLGLWLLRSVYIENKRDPTPLRDPDLYPDTDTLKAHLLDELIPSILDKRRRIPSKSGLLRTQRQWCPDDVHRWLSYLAVHLDGERDLRWWAVPAFAPFAARVTVGVAGALVFGVAFGLVAGVGIDLQILLERDLEDGMQGRFISAIAIGLSIAVVAGLLFTLILGAAIRGTPEPGYAKMQLHGRGRLLVRSLTAGLGTGAFLGLVTSLVYDALGLLIHREVHLWGMWTLIIALVGLLAAVAAGSVMNLVDSVISGDHMQQLRASPQSNRRTRTVARDLVAGSVAGIAVGIAFSLYSWLLFGEYGIGVMERPGAWLSIGATVGAVVGLACRTAIRSTQVSKGATAQRSGFAQDVIIGLLAGFAVTMAAASADILPMYWLANTTLFMLVIGSIVGLVGGLVNWVRSPAHGDRPRTPLSAYKDSRTLTAVLWSVALLLVAVIGLTVGFVEGRIDIAALTTGLVVGLTAGLVLVLWIGRTETAWLGFIAITRWLAYKRELPWGTMQFLDEAHRLGLLRSAGAVYQFRHAELQDHLARRAEPRPATCLPPDPSAAD